MFGAERHFILVQNIPSKLGDQSNLIQWASNLVKHNKRLELIYNSHTPHEYAVDPLFNLKWCGYVAN